MDSAGELGSARRAPPTRDGYTDEHAHRAPASAGPASAEKAPPSLLILSDIRFLSEGLVEVLERDGAFEVAGPAADLGEALAMMREMPRQIILIDTALPAGLDAVMRLRDLRPEARIVALALAETEANVIAWAEAGISGYIPRSAALEDLVGYLKGIARGEQACSTRVAGGLLRWISGTSRATGRRAPAAEPSELTAREEQVVRLVCAGLSNKEISRRLNIGLATTKSHVHNVLCKLELEGRGQVVRWSRDHAPALAMEK